MTYKIPISVLVVIHTPVLEVLLLERAHHPGFWQSVTGSLDRPDESLQEAAAREVLEETGIECQRDDLIDWDLTNTFEIFPVWRHRYAPGIEHNVEHVFSLQRPAPSPIRLAPAEHTAHVWLPWEQAAEKCFSWSNRNAIRLLPEKLGAAAFDKGLRR
jgi:dATP pyrophosphohydrolase